jgi:hypothetical protein
MSSDRQVKSLAKQLISLEHYLYGVRPFQRGDGDTKLDELLREKMAAGHRLIAQHYRRREMPGSAADG